MKKIAVLTYTTKHRKTYDLLSLLKANGYKDVKIYAMPFYYKKKIFPSITHRPEMHFQLPKNEELCLNLGYSYVSGGLDSFNISQDRIVLIAGAGILPNEFVNNHIVINSHPGYIPNCRGLDALKWAIIERQPIGVTTHLVGNEIDAGKIIERRLINIYKTDTFHAVAQRVYENEVAMLVEALDKYHYSYLQNIAADSYPIHKRMPIETEQNLLKRFEEYKALFAKDRVPGIS